MRKVAYRLDLETISYWSWFVEFIFYEKRKSNHLRRERERERDEGCKEKKLTEEEEEKEKLTEKQER